MGQEEGGIARDRARGDAVWGLAGVLRVFAADRLCRGAEALFAICRLASLLPTPSIRSRPSRRFCWRCRREGGVLRTPVCCVLLKLRKFLAYKGGITQQVQAGLVHPGLPHQRSIWREDNIHRNSPRARHPRNHAVPGLADSPANSFASSLHNRRGTALPCPYGLYATYRFINESKPNLNRTLPTDSRPRTPGLRTSEPAASCRWSWLPGQGPMGIGRKTHPQMEMWCLDCPRTQRALGLRWAC